jgi:hypothetical protein
MPKVNMGNVLSQANPMNMIGRMGMGNPMHSIQDAFGGATRMSPMTQAMDMLQRHPQDPQMQNKMDEDGMRQMLGQHMSQQQQNPQMPKMQNLMHPNPMVNMSGMNMSQMMGAQPQEQELPSPMMNPNMGTKSGMAPMGTPMNMPQMSAPPMSGAGQGLMGAMNALNAQRPSDSFVDPQRQKMMQMQRMQQMIGRNK